VSWDASGDRGQHLVAFRPGFRHLRQQFVPRGRRPLWRIAGRIHRDGSEFLCGPLAGREFRPGIFDESKMLAIPLPLRICETSRLPGHDCLLAGVAQEGAGDIGVGRVDVFHTLQIGSLIIDSHRAFKQILRDSLLNQEHALAWNLVQCEIVPHQHGVVAVGIIADDDRGGIDTRWRPACRAPPCWSWCRRRCSLRQMRQARRIVEALTLIATPYLSAHFLRIPERAMYW